MTLDIPQLLEPQLENRQLQTKKAGENYSEANAAVSLMTAIGYAAFGL